MSQNRDLGRVQIGKGELTGHVWGADGPTVTLDFPGAYIELAGADNLRAIARVLLLAADGKRIDGEEQQASVASGDDLAGLARAADGGGS